MSIVTPLRDPDQDRLSQTPSNTEAEQALLGAILINNIAYSRVADFLRPEHFASVVHGRVYAAIGKLIARGHIADPITLKNLFDQDGALTEVGGPQYLARLAEAAVTIINAPHYAEAIVDVARRRELISAGQALIDAAYASDDIPGTVSAALARLPGAAALTFTCAADLANIPAPDRPWIVPDWIPRRQVTLFAGDGGVGKSTIAMQLQAATSAGIEWLGLPVVRCRSLALYAEDEADELHRRLRSIVELPGLNGAAFCDAHWRSVVGDAAELVDVGDDGAVRPTLYFRQVARAALDFRAQLLILDALTNLYGADEIRRRQVNGFVGLLRQLAIKMDGAVLLLAHPSMQGITTGSGLSGSTHWNNAVRSRLYLTRTAGDDADPDERELTRLKANYAGIGDVLRIRWQRGGFVAIEAPTGIDRAALGAKAERVFRALLMATYAEGTWCSPNPAARNYAPSLFTKRPDREGLGKQAFEGATHRLLRTADIKTETYGRPSEPRTRLAPT